MNSPKHHSIAYTRMNNVNQVEKAFIQQSIITTNAGIINHKAEWKTLNGHKWKCMFQLTNVGVRDVTSV